MAVPVRPVAAAEKIVEVLRPYVSESRRRRIEEVLSSRTRSVTVVLEDLVSDHNGAAVLRTADALGLMEVHLIPLPTGFRVSRKVALGAQKWVETNRHTGIDAAYRALRARGFQIWASAVHGEAAALDEIPEARPLALVFGNEHAGLSERAVALADGCFRLPMYGFVESLNISVATALSLASVLERRRRGGQPMSLDPEDRARVRADWYVRSVRAAPQLLERAGLSLERECDPAVRLVDDEVYR